MTHKSWHLDRRSFLRGSGVACALPFFEGMTPRLTKTTGAPKRIAFVYFPNGVSLPDEKDEAFAQWRWFPHGDGTEYRFTKVLASLEPFRKDLTILGGLSHPLSRELLGHLAGDTWLTAGDVRGDRYKNTISVDQVAARVLRKHTRYPFLALSTDGGVGYKSRVATLSFDQSGRPIPSENRQRSIFERYFSAGGKSSLEARRASIERGKRIVDLVLEDSKSLRRRLGKRDVTKLDEFLASLESVEEQIERNETWLDIPMKDVDTSRLDLDPDPRKDPTAYLRATYELMALALETDLTRVMTFQTGREDGMGFADQFPRLAVGVARGHHTISHDSHAGHWEQWGRYDTWHAEQFAHFVRRLTELEDEHGRILDNTLVLYGSCCSTTHNARNYPLVLAGGSKLGLKHGSYRKYDEATPLSNLFVAMLGAVGVPVPSFADSKGTLPELFA
ncbi:MAG: DUF1552 domain-containing protein [Planctomycetes bacterium]|nr:DUF1552 domain-containing protein [Planctomycetota bacterium]